MKRTLCVLVLPALVLPLSCSSAPKVTRMADTTVTDISGSWNDTDSRLVSEKMIPDMLNKPWYKDWTDSKGKKPVVIVGRIKNESMEHINSRAFVADIEREMINSGKIAFAAGGGDRDALRLERIDQLQNASDETIKNMGKEIGADFMLFGAITSFIDQAGGKKAVSYQIDLYLVDIEKNIKAWAGQEKIKKMITRSRMKM